MEKSEKFKWKIYQFLWKFFLHFRNFELNYTLLYSRLKTQQITSLSSPYSLPLSLYWALQVLVEQRQERDKLGEKKPVNFATQKRKGFSQRTKSGKLTHETTTGNSDPFSL